MPSTAQPPYWGKLLRSGSRGPDVALVQTWLNTARRRWTAIRPVAVDGRYGNSTAMAVKNFQKVAGLHSDGEVGPDTWDGLYQAAAVLSSPDNVYPGIPLRLGQSGATVKSAQQKLQTLVTSLKADGEFGEKTREAVRAYQTVESLPDDGVIGRRTWNILFGL